MIVSRWYNTIYITKLITLPVDVASSVVPLLTRQHNVSESHLDIMENVHTSFFTIKLFKNYHFVLDQLFEVMFTAFISVRKNL